MNQFFVLAQGTVKTQTLAAQPQTQTQTVTQTTPAKGTNGAKAAPEQQGAFGGIMGMLPMILIFAAMFYLMWRGQAKERKKREEMLSSIKAGDKVITIGGLCGTIVEVKAEGYLIKIADNVKIETTKNAIGSVVTPETAAAEKK